MRESQRRKGREVAGNAGLCRANAPSRASKGALARGAFVRGALAAIASIGTLGPFPPEAFAQSGAEVKGAGGAPAAPGKAAGAGGAPAGGEASGAGGAPAAEKQAPPAAEIKVVIFVEGAKATEVRAEIESSLPPGVKVLPDAPFAEALKKRGFLPLAKSIKGVNERRASAPKLQGAAQDVGAQAAIVASANVAKGGKYDVPMLIVPSDSPEPLVSTNAIVSSKDGSQPRAEAIAGIVSASISGIIPVAPPPPETKVETVEIVNKEPEVKKVEPPKPPPPPMNKFVRGKFLFEIGLGTQGRSFFYLMPPNLDREDNIRDYDILVAQHASLRADVYPFAGPEDSFLGHVGLTAAGGASFGVKSTLADKNDSTTTIFNFRVGPKMRFPLGPGEKPPLITGELAYSHYNFTFDDPSRTAASFVYQSIRPGVGVRFPVGPVVALFEGGLHYVVASPELEARFPNATTLGFDAQLGVGLPLGTLFEARLNVNYNRYRANLKADVDSDTGYVAAGAVDQFFGAHLGLAVAP